VHTFFDRNLARVPAQDVSPYFSRMFLLDQPDQISRTEKGNFDSFGDREVVLTFPTSIRFTPSLPLHSTTCVKE
jgi:hypothetical protein